MPGWSGVALNDCFVDEHGAMQIHLIDTGVQQSRIPLFLRLWILGGCGLLVSQPIPVTRVHRGNNTATRIEQEDIDVLGRVRETPHQSITVDGGLRIYLCETLRICLQKQDILKRINK